jgi:hypothetical protein
MTAVWAGLVRVPFLHRVTWSINSICHMIGDRPFVCRDKAANFWPPAVLFIGDSWHTSHHTDPTCARHGVLRGQVGISARLIWTFERSCWISDVRWTNPARADPHHRHHNGAQRIPRAAAVLPDLEPGTEPLTVTARRIPPDAFAVVIQIAHEISPRCAVPMSGGRSG